MEGTYSLPDLIDLSLAVPEIGAVNFNLLRLVLHTVVKECRLDEVRPWFKSDNPLLAKTELTKAKLKQVKRSWEGDSAPVTPPRKPAAPTSKQVEPTSEERKPADQPKPPPQPEKYEPTLEEDEPSPEPQQNTKPFDSTPEPKTLVQDDPPVQSEEAEPEPDPGRAPTRKDSSVQVDADKDLPKSRESQTDFQEQEEESQPLSPQERAKKFARAKEEIPDDIVLPPPPSIVEDSEQPSESTLEHSKGGKSGRASMGWKLTNLTSRVEGAEEGLYRLSNIMDIIADKIKKAEQRKKEGGPQSEELEAIDDRILELEEGFTRFSEDHDVLMDNSKSLSKLLSEFDEIKKLAALIKQMQIDIATKADKEETEAALALKGDLELVNTKVDQLEFETAIEELGEAIGLLGLKFTRKNDEWEERAAEIWRGIDKKMSRDVFDEAMAKVQSRLTALMFGLRKVKKVVEELLYPEAGGVTRCIVCRRPACIAGLECLGPESPKRRLSARTPDSEDSKKLGKALDDVMAKRQKLEEPPYCQSRDTIFSLPYSSSTYRTSVDDPQDMEGSIRLAPISFESESRASEVPKLPDINGVPATDKRSDRKQSVGRSKSKKQQAELVFTRKRLAELEKTENVRPVHKDEKVRYTAVLEDPSSSESSKPSSSRSSLSGVVYIMPDASQTTDSFAPVRAMPDMLRRTVLSPTSPKEHSPSMTVDPMFSTSPTSSSQSGKPSDSDRDSEP